MSDKFGSTEYDPANGTFSNITIRSKVVELIPSAHSVHDTASSMTTSSVVVPGTESDSESLSDPTFNWSFMTVIVLLSFLCFATGCCVAWFGVARAQQQRLTESEMADIDRKEKHKVASPSPESTECAEITVSGTVHIVMRKRADLELEGMETAEEKEGILGDVEREETFYSEDLYITNTENRAPSPRHLHPQITVTPHHLSTAFSSDPSQFSKLQRYGVQLELPRSPEPSTDVSDSEPTPGPTDIERDASISLSAAIHLGVHPMKQRESDQHKKSDADKVRKEYDATSTVLGYLAESTSIGSISSYKE